MVTLSLTMAGGLPICRYDANKRMFLVIKYKGKTLTNGGYGVSDNDRKLATNDTTAEPPDTAITPTSNYLFLEDVIFLHEQGLVHVEENVHSSTMESRHLYSLLHGADGLLSLSVYLVYAHLRAQTYRVVRHTSSRKSLLLELTLKRETSNETKRTTTTTTTFPVSRMTKIVKEDLRRDAMAATPPTMYEPAASLTIAFDVYPPDSNFKRSNPGLPSFHVAVCSFAQSSPTFGEMQELLRQCGNTPLRIATVADSGTVVMFGLTDFGVPVIKTRIADDDIDKIIVPVPEENNGSAAQS